MGGELSIQVVAKLSHRWRWTWVVVARCEVENVDPRTNSENRRNLMKMVMDESGEESTPKKDGHPKSSFVVMVNCVKVPARFSS